MTPRTPSRPGQGPDWLIGLLLNPPNWLGFVYAIVVIAVVGTLTYRLHGRGLKQSEADQMRGILTIVTSVLCATLAMVFWSPTGYLLDVVIGWLVGYGGVVVSRRPEIRGIVYDGADDAERRVVAWLVIATVAFVGPSVIVANGVPFPVARGFVGTLATGMLLRIVD